LVIFDGLQGLFAVKEQLRGPGFFVRLQREISSEIFRLVYENKEGQSGRYGEEKNLYSCREFNSECSDFRPVTYSVILSDMTVLAKIWTTFPCFVCAVEASCRAYSLSNTDAIQWMCWSLEYWNELVTHGCLQNKIISKFIKMLSLFFIQKQCSG
jgi:hypothetical protein